MSALVSSTSLRVEVGDRTFRVAVRVYLDRDYLRIEEWLAGAWQHVGGAELGSDGVVRFEPTTGARELPAEVLREVADRATDAIEWMRP